MDIGDQDKPWAPHIICGSCRSNLEGWLRGFGKVMSLQFSEFGKSPKIIISKCRKVSRRRAMIYPNIPSSIASVPHSETLPVPNPPSNVSVFCGSLTLIYLL